jgi:ankyrin repeat protein
MKNKLFIFIILSFNLIGHVSDFRKLVFILHNSTNNVKNFKKALSKIEKLNLSKEAINCWLGAPDGETDGVLHDATEFNDPTILKRLLALGLDINDRGIRYLITPLLCAASSENIKSAKFLIENGADVNIDNRAGDTPLVRASLNFNKEITKLLIENGAQVPKNLLTLVEEQYLKESKNNEKYYGINSSKKEALEFIEWLKKFLKKISVDPDKYAAKREANKEKGDPSYALKENVFKRYGIKKIWNKEKIN